MVRRSSQYMLCFLAVASIFLLLTACGSIPTASSPTPTVVASRSVPSVKASFKEFSVQGADLTCITPGPDGAIWFTIGSHIGRITSQGAITQFQLAPTANPYHIVAGPDGALWFTDPPNNKIGRLTPLGKVDEFALPRPVSHFPYDITVGSDGALWFTEQTGEGTIGRVTTNGSVTEFSSPSFGSTLGIAAGPDGALWFTESTVNKIGRITTSGIISEYAIPTQRSLPEGITAGSDGALWFAEDHSNKIGRITTTGTITEYVVPTAGSAPYDITTNPNRTLWFTEQHSSKIGQITITH